MLSVKKLALESYSHFFLLIDNFRITFTEVISLLVHCNYHYTVTSAKCQAKNLHSKSEI